MKRLIPALFLLAGAPLSAAQPDPAQSRIGFTLKQLNVPLDGSFRKFGGTVAFDPKAPQAGKADLTIDTTSIALPTRDAETEARKKDWFNVAQYPTARFVSTTIKPLGGNRFQVSGKLTLKGVTRDLSAPFTIRQDGKLTHVEGSLPVKRTQFKIGEGEWADTGTVADEVVIKFHIAFAGT
ncbi:YceI family protein [Paludibacterium paludis]|uniref:Polyisoprenoid-binding protein n=1 Tax=Paludibacterium paludis TaxID=1225769 RepID=A0A918UBW5_9NEIS|nr:YceI family protein [Paludibacterium paludis]GGY27866.1 polyisoprenoid-binding protein [Paludibacterium paludis]